MERPWHFFERNVLQIHVVDRGAADCDPLATRLAIKVTGELPGDGNLPRCFLIVLLRLSFRFSIALLWDDGRLFSRVELSREKPDWLTDDDPKLIMFGLVCLLLNCFVVICIWL